MINATYSPELPDPGAMVRIPTVFNIHSKAYPWMKEHPLQHSNTPE